MNAVFVSLLKFTSMQPVITGDGSHTLFVQELNEYYHSIHGAVTESKHVFIRYGLCTVRAKTIAVFEVGFGTGLNALLTANYALRSGLNITYLALEKYPLDRLTTGHLNYPDILPGEDGQSYGIFNAIHEAPWNEEILICSGFRLHKIQADLLCFNPDFNYDILYFDAFSPEKQPEMWSEDIMHKLISRLNPGGVFTTYCAKGSVRRLLLKNGLYVERLPGPPGKREMLRGVKK